MQTSWMNAVRRWPRCAAVAVGAAALLVAPEPVRAQIANAVVEVQAADAAKAPLPGVAVRLASSATGFERRALTGADGGARFAAVPPGTYQLRLELDGFTPVTQDPLVLRVGQVARINATMAQVKQTEQVTVTATAPLVDVVKTDSSTNIVPEQIESLPVADRQFERLAFIAPGVQRERGEFRFIGGGPVIGAGGNASQSTILVDGVDMTDPALGLARARLSQDAIREFKVITNRFDAEIGGSAGGALSIVTRSGANQFTGSVFSFYRANSLRAKGKFEKDDLSFSRGQYGFTFGGPLSIDKIHFFASTEYIDEKNVSLFRPQGAYVSQAKDVDHPFNQMLGFASLDHQLNPSQRVTAKYVWDRYREENFRVGGVQDVSYGQQLRRDNWNLTLEHTLVPSANYLNELRAQIGTRSYYEPANSSAMAEWFSSGNTLRTGMNILGDLLGEGREWELRDTAHVYSGRHELKMGVSVQHIKERSRITTFQSGLMLYLTDTRALPLAYSYGVGSADVNKSTTLYAGFLQDNWRPRSNLTLNVGLRYDLDTDGNNPDFNHPMVPNGRKRDTNNYQPRFGFSWDVGNDGRNLVRGGWGRFTGRYLLVPAFTELQQNGVTGRVTYTRINGALIGLPQFALDPAHPTTTGIRLNPAITLLDTKFDSPQADQATLGWTMRVGQTGLYFDTEAIYVDGTNEIAIRDTNFVGNAALLANPKTPIRLNKSYDQINVYTNDGRSKYKALVFSLNGTIRGGHLVTASFTIADKKNISDDFSPEFPFGYPNDPTNIGAEYGRSRSDERYRLVLSGVFKLPWGFTVAPIYEYGSGQPWNHRLGYDYNGDGKNSDRPAGVARNSMDGPPFRQLSLRVSKGFALAGARLEAIAEAFNVFNTVNYNVNSVDAAEFLSGPTITNPTAKSVPNPNYGKYSATLPGREIQLGLRLSF